MDVAAFKPIDRRSSVDMSKRERPRDSITRRSSCFVAASYGFPAHTEIAVMRVTTLVTKVPVQARREVT
jgi:hypothetical protein